MGGLGRGGERQSLRDQRGRRGSKHSGAGRWGEERTQRDKHLERQKEVGPEKEKREERGGESPGERRWYRCVL